MDLKIYKIGGSILDDEPILSAFLNEFSQYKGPKILVHGGGKLATSMGKRMGLEEQYVDGRRITDEKTLELVTMVYGGLINKNLVAGLQNLHCPSVGLCGADGATILAHQRPVGKVDFGKVGDLEPENFDLKLVRLCLDNGFSPIISSLSYAPGQGLLNTNADTMASALAGSLSEYYSVDLYFYFDKEGVLDGEAKLIPVLNEKAIEKNIEEGIIRDGMLPKIQNALNALKSGVRAVYIMGSQFFLKPYTGDSHAGTKVTLL